MLEQVHGELGMQMSVIEEGVSQWAGEVSVLLDACRQLVEYYGTDAEGLSFQEAAKAPLWLIEALRQLASGKNADTTKAPPFSKLACSEALGAMLTPLLRIVVEWKPDFVADAFEILDEEARRKIIAPYGQFIGTVGMNLSGPVWRTYPHLTPPGWSA